MKLSQVFWNWILGWALIGIAGIATASQAQRLPELTTVKDLDLERYQGVWNQVAAIPASFQRDCIANTTAEYSLLSNGWVRVVNSCDRKDQSRKSSEARARVNRKFGETSKLEVTFVHFIDWIWAFSGDYWVTYLNEGYETVIVGDPKRKFGWILSRKTKLSISEYTKMAWELSERDYDPCDFNLSNTAGQNFTKTTSLCDFVLGPR